MKNVLVLIVVLISSLVLAVAHGNKPAEAKAEVHGQTITVVYTAPHLNGRDVNELLKRPRANPWRLGADDPTKLSSPIDLQFGGTPGWQRVITDCGPTATRMTTGGCRLSTLPARWWPGSRCSEPKPMNPRTTWSFH